MKAKYVRHFLMEGVSDKYLERTFNISDETRSIDNQIKEKKGEYFGLVGNNLDTTKIYKNPTSLENFDHDVRGIIVKNKDIYLLDKMVDVKHEEIIAFLQERKILKAVKGNTYEQIINNLIYKSENYYLQNLYDYIPIERIKRTDTFEYAYSVSTNTPHRDINKVKKIISIIEKKYPYFKFIVN